MTTDTTPELELNGSPLRLERPSARKATRALALLRALTKAAPGIQAELARFRRDYEQANYVELTPAQARHRFPPRIVWDEEGETPLREPATLPDGGENPNAGKLVMSPSFVDSISEEEWQRSGGVLRLPASPSEQEVYLAMLDSALELAEDHVYRLLALFTLPNADVKKAWGDGTYGDLLDQRVDELLDELEATELLELGVRVGELLEGTLVTKARELGDRLGNLRRLIARPAATGQAPTPATSTDGPPSSTPQSSTPSPEPTEDDPTQGSSTSPGTSSSPSLPASPTTPPEPERSA